jgi:hypothetical protein
MTTYPRVLPRSQFGDPTTTQDGLNCTPTSFVMLLDLAADIIMYPGEFRRLQGDMEGGISIPDGARAWKRATSATLEWAAPNDGTVPPIRRGDGITADQALSIASSGKGLVWQGLYKVLEDAGFGLQPGFTAGHAVYVDGFRLNTLRQKQAYIIDPLGKSGYIGQWIPWNVLIRYGTALGHGDLIYAAWAGPALPDTSGEDMETIVNPVPRGTGHVSSAGIVTIVTADGKARKNVQLTDVLADVQEYSITRDGVAVPGILRRLAESPYAGYYVDSGVVTWKPPPATGDVKHEVVLRIDGNVVADVDV